MTPIARASAPLFCGAFVSFALFCLARPATAAEAPPAQVPTSEQFQGPSRPFDLHWQILMVPERIIEIAFTPLAIVIGVFDEYQLAFRIYDALRTEDGRVVVTPSLSLSSSDGLGFGGALSIESLAGGEEWLDVGLRLRLNGDHEERLRYRQSIASLEGRILEVDLRQELDHNLPYYGLGNDSTRQRHALYDAWFDGTAAIDLFGRGARDVRGRLELGFRQEELRSGVDPNHAAVTPTSDVEPPVGFGRKLEYTHVRAVCLYDSRDNVANAGRGLIAEIDTVLTRNLNDADIDAASAHGEFELFVPVLPRRRVVVLAAGSGMAQPLKGHHDVPFHRLVTLGREQFLLGYSRSRFRDHFGWWSTIAYQFPAYESRITYGEVTARFFANFGRVARRVPGLFEGPVRYSGGIKLSGTVADVEIFGLTVAMSPDGLETLIKIGREL